MHEIQHYSLKFFISLTLASLFTVHANTTISQLYYVPATNHFLLLQVHTEEFSWCNEAVAAVYLQLRVAAQEMYSGVFFSTML